MAVGLGLLGRGGRGRRSGCGRSMSPGRPWPARSSAGWSAGSGAGGAGGVAAVGHRRRRPPRPGARAAAATAEAGAAAAGAAALGAGDAAARLSGLGAMLGSGVATPIFHTAFLVLLAAQLTGGVALGLISGALFGAARQATALLPLLSLARPGADDGPAGDAPPRRSPPERGAHCRRRPRPRPHRPLTVRRTSGRARHAAPPDAGVARFCEVLHQGDFVPDGDAVVAGQGIDGLFFARGRRRRDRWRRCGSHVRW